MVVENERHTGIFKCLPKAVDWRHIERAERISVDDRIVCDNGGFRKGLAKRLPDRNGHSAANIVRRWAALESDSEQRDAGRSRKARCGRCKFGKMRGYFCRLTLVDVTRRHRDLGMYPKSFQTFGKDVRVLR